MRQVKISVYRADNFVYPDGGVDTFGSPTSFWTAFYQVLLQALEPEVKDFSSLQELALFCGQSLEVRWLIRYNNRPDVRELLH